MVEFHNWRFTRIQQTPSIELRERLLEIDAIRNRFIDATGREVESILDTLLKRSDINEIPQSTQAAHR